MDSAGDCIIAWTDKSTNPATIKAVARESSGSSLAEFVAGAIPTKQVDFPSVGIAPTGNFVVAWQSNIGGPAAQDIRRNSITQPERPSSPIRSPSTRTPRTISRSRAWRCADGSFAITFESNNQDGNGQGIYAQDCTAAGAASGSEFLVNTTTQGNQQDPAIAWSGNNQVIAWDGQGTQNGVTINSGIFLKRFATTGSANQPPTLTVPGTQNSVKNTPLTFSSANGNPISVSDADGNGGLEQVTVEASNGTLAFNTTAGLAVTPASSGSSAGSTLVGTLAQLNAALNGMRFTPTTNFTGTASITIEANDQGNSGGGGPQSSPLDTVSIVVHNPTASDSIPGPQSTTRDVPVTFKPENSNAIYIGSGWNATDLAASHGTFTLATTSGLSFGGGTSNYSPHVQFSGTVAAMNAALDGLIFTPTTGFTGSDTINLTLSSSGLLGLGLLGSSTTYTIPVAINPTPPSQNLAPILTAPGTQAIAENGSLTFSASLGNRISFTDADANNAVEQLTLTGTAGLVQLATTTGLTILSGTGAGDASCTVTGPVSNLVAALDGLVFTPSTNFFGSGGVSITVDDLGNTGAGGAKSATLMVPINVTPVNQPPTISVPAQQSSNENTSVVFSNAGGDPITVADIDADGNSETLSLSVANGSLALAATTGLTFNSAPPAGNRR